MSIRHRRTRVLDTIQSPRTVLLGIGDVLAVSSFIVVGLLHHSIEPWVQPSYAVSTALPFVIAWVLVSPVSGAYAVETIRSARKSLVVISIGWFAASILGGMLRATSLFHGGVQLDFLLVNVVFGLAFLLPWRLGCVYVYRLFVEGT